MYDALALTKHTEKCWGCGNQRHVMNFNGLCEECLEIY